MIGLVDRIMPPCKDCQKRYFKCRGHCEDYAVYLNEFKADKVKRYAMYSEGDLYGMNRARRTRAKKAIRKRDGK